MQYDKGKQITIKDLKKLIKYLPDDTKVFVGFGERVEPLHYLCEYGDDLMLHSDIYGMDATEFNLKTIATLASKNR